MKNTQKNLVLKELNEINKLTSMSNLLKKKIDHNDLSVAKNSIVERSIEGIFVFSGIGIAGSLHDLIPLSGDTLVILVIVNIFSFILFSIAGIFHLAGKANNRGLLSFVRKQINIDSTNLLEYQKQIEATLKNKIKAFRENKECINTCIEEFPCNPEYQKHKEFLLPEILNPILTNETKLLSLKNDDNLKIEIS